MRPNTAQDEMELYECFECGARSTSPDSRFCPACGGELRHLSRSRDL
ncbi:MAG: rubrerythrin-like domain-containing protein [Halobacteriales archaeon]